MADIIYLNLSPKIQITQAEITVADVAEVTCKKEELLEQIKKIQIYKMGENHSRRIISCLKVISCIERAFPSVIVMTSGAEEVIVEYSAQPEHNKCWEIFKVIFVGCVTFFGTGFTIMAFHNDIGIRNVFEQIASMIVGKAQEGMLTLEISYAFGLTVGIVVFFNHIGKRRITHDPTPIEVSMRKYEDDVNMTLTESWDREGGTIDAP